MRIDSWDLSTKPSAGAIAETRSRQFLSGLSRFTPGNMAATLLVVVGLLVGCSARDLTRERAEVLLNEALKKDLSSSCTLHPTRFYAKPEFVNLRAERFCDQTIAVTGIHKPSEKEAIAEFKTVMTANAMSLKKYLAAIESVEARLSDLQHQKLRRGLVDPPVWVWKDPIDGQVFSLECTSDAYFSSRGCILPARGIKETNRWKQIDWYKGFASDLLQSGRLECGRATPEGCKGLINPTSLAARFRLYDDGWRLVDASGTRFIVML